MAPQPGEPAGVAPAGIVAGPGERPGAVAGQEGGRIRELERERRNTPAEGSDGDAGQDKAWREEQAQAMRRLERRLAQVESGQGVVAADGAGGRSAAGGTARRRYSDLVTHQLADDDAAVYGAARPLVAEWRRLWEGHRATGRGLAWVATRERILGLEVRLLEEHGLTLPQETEPLRGLDRNAQLSWRKQAQEDIRRQRARLELLRWTRRVFTLGLWR